MKYLIIISSLFLVTTCGMISHYDLIECIETQDLSCNVMKTFSSEEMCDKYAKELNNDSTSYLYYCEQKGPFQR